MLCLTVTASEEVRIFCHFVYRLAWFRWFNASAGWWTRLKLKRFQYDGWRTTSSRVADTWVGWSFAISFYWFLVVVVVCLFVVSSFFLPTYLIHWRTLQIALFKVPYMPSRGKADYGIEVILGQTTSVTNSVIIPRVTRKVVEYLKSEDQTY